MVEDRFESKVGNSVNFMISSLWVIEHPFPFFLLDANVVFRGQREPSWNFKGIYHNTDPRTRTFPGSVRFRCKSKVEEVPLAHAA